MKSQWKTIAYSVAITAAATSIAAPGDRQNRGPIDLNEVQARAAETFAAVDTVADGMITLEEFLAAEPQTMALNLRDGRGKARSRRGPPAFARSVFGNAGGEIDEDALAERRAAFETRRAERAERRSEHRDAVFSLADTDASGELSKTEYDEIPAVDRTIKKQEMFSRLDQNGDEFLTAEEFPPHVEHLRSLDTNGDGLVTRDEMPRRRPRG